MSLYDLNHFFTERTTRTIWTPERLWRLQLFLQLRIFTTADAGNYVMLSGLHHHDLSPQEEYLYSALTRHHFFLLCIS